VRRALAGGIAGLFIVLVAAVATPRAAKACSCAPRGSEAEYVAASDVAFDGTAVSKTAGASANTYTFRIDAKVKGEPTNPQDVNTAKDSAACGMDFTLGTAYRIYANKSDGGVLVTGLCSGDHEVGGSAPTVPTTAPPKPSTTAPPHGATSSSLLPSTSTSRTTAPPPPTIANLVPETVPSFDVTSTSGNLAIKVDDSKPGANRLVIASILVAALGAIGAGVILWRRGP
jgi:hypothetical protein